MPPPMPAAGRLGGASVVFLALAAATPLAVVTTVIPDAYAGSNALALPLLFLALGALLLIFVTGYAAMARRLPQAGALYSFIARGIGRPLGIGAGWLALLSYHALQLSLYAAAGVIAAPHLSTFGVQWWMVALGCWATVALCGLLRITATAWLLIVVVPAELAVIVGYSAADVLQPAGGRLTWATLTPATLLDVPRPALALLLVVAALTFIGVETTAAYSEETRGPSRTITRATYLSVTLLAILYAAAGWAMSVATGPARITAEAGARGPELLFDLAAARLAPWAVTLGRITLVTGLLAAMIALHQTLARYLFALGRERILPPALGRTSPRTTVPRAASLTQTVLAGPAIGAGALLHLDPAESARLLGIGGGLGILVLLVGTSLAALMFLNRHPNGEGAWSRLLAPGLSTVALGVLTYLAFADLTTLLGVPDHRVLIVPGMIAGAILAGIAHGLAVRKGKPLAYAGIGLGGTAVVVSPVSPPIPKPRVPGAHRPERINRELSH